MYTASVDNNPTHETKQKNPPKTIHEWKKTHNQLVVVHAHTL